MNTQSYKLFIEDIKSQNRGLEKEVGFEIHHILPRALGGDNTENNLVKLSYYEHIIAHYLIAKETNNPKMLFAFQRMLCVRYKKLSELEIESFLGLNDFYKIRDTALNLHRQKMIEDNPMKKESVRNKVSESLKKFYKDNPDKIKEMSERLKMLYDEKPELRKKLL